jgi:Glycosyl hydrolase family 20, catalytic domain
MGNRNRREFLVGAGVTIGSVALSQRMFGEIRTTNPDLMVPKNDSTPASSAAKATPQETNESEPRKTATRGKMRGLMVDAGRVPESLEYYRRIIDFCADWQLNTLHFRLADDQGSALNFASIRDLVTHKNAFAPEQLRSLAEYAQTRGIDLIPELESFGHTGYITRSAAYAHLLDREAQGPSEFTGVIPVHPETQQLFSKLYRELATIFPSIYLHGGCDEVNWGGSALSSKALQTKSRAQIWAEYLNSLHQIAVDMGRQLIVWGDVVIHKEPEILGKLNKTIIIMDWNYRDNSSARIREAFLKVRTNGNRGIGAPGLINYRWGPRAGIEQLQNIDAYADAYLEQVDPSSLGVILTNWVPSRYVQNSIWDGFAYAAVAFNDGTATAQKAAFRRFVERHYGANWNENWKEAFQIIYDAAPSVQEQPSASWTGIPLKVPWSNDEQLAAALRIRSPRQNPFTRLQSVLVHLEPEVLKNLADFQSFVLCIEALQRRIWREAVVIEQVAKEPLKRETIELLQDIAVRDQALAEALSKDWDNGRFPDSAAKSELLFDLEPKDQLLLQWVRAAKYSASLARNPERFHKLLEAAKPV